MVERGFCHIFGELYFGKGWCRIGNMNYIAWGVNAVKGRGGIFVWIFKAIVSLF
jgi:hypothetical protein